jgi:hypothetical protein
MGEALLFVVAVLSAVYLARAGRSSGNKAGAPADVPEEA